MFLFLFCLCVQFANSALNSCAADILVGYYGYGGDLVTPAAAGDWQVCVTCVPTFEHGHGDPSGTVLPHACCSGLALANRLAKVLNNLLQHETL